MNREMRQLKLEDETIDLGKKIERLCEVYAVELKNDLYWALLNEDEFTITMHFKDSCLLNVQKNSTRKPMIEIADDLDVIFSSNAGIGVPE